MLKDFMDIVLDKDSFKAGEEVTGRVYLNCRKPLRAHSVKVSLTGEAFTGWSSSSSRPKFDFHRAGLIYKLKKYNQSERLIGQYDTLWSSEAKNAGTIPAGLTTYPFSFQLPSDCLQTFHGGYGKISYKLKCRLNANGNWKGNEKVKKVLTVKANCDLNKLEIEEEGVYGVDRNTGLIFKNGIVSYEVTVPKHGFVPGESIPISFKIDNLSSKTVYTAQAYLRQVSVYRAGGFEKVAFYTLKDSISRTKRSIAPGTKGTAIVELKVPETATTFKSELITVNYQLFVGVRSKSTFRGNLWTMVPVTIGTVAMEKKPTSEELLCLC